MNSYCIIKSILYLICQKLPKLQGHIKLRLLLQNNQMWQMSI